MVKHVAFFLSLLIISLYISHTVDAKSEIVTLQEVKALKAQAQDLRAKYAVQQTKTKSADEVNRIQKIIHQLNEYVTRLHEVDDMPLSRSEAEKIQAHLQQLENNF